jgi:hypothetical protein
MLAEFLHCKCSLAFHARLMRRLSPFDERSIMTKHISAALIAASFLLGGCSSDDVTGSNNDQPPVGDTTVVTTTADGRATVAFQGGDKQFELGVILRNFDTGGAAAGLEVHAIALADGIFLHTEDPQGRFAASTQYVPYSLFQTERTLRASGARATASPAASPAPVLLAVYGIVIAVFSVGSTIYEYATDPPGFEEVFNDQGVKEVCLKGDLNDVLAAWGASGIKTISGAIRVFGAPAKLRGVTSINLGFTRVEIYKQFNREAFTTLLDEYTGWLNTDVRVWCWPKVGDKIVPLIRGEVTRSVTQFDIVRVFSQSTYPVAPSRDQITTTVGAQWSGSPTFPVSMIITPISCYPGWVCYDWIRQFNSSANPLSQTFGCWGSSPTAQSGSMTFRIELRDKSGLTTPPATFNFRCGTFGSSYRDASASILEPGGFVGAPLATH